jgi:hypothetical protein
MTVLIGGMTKESQMTEAIFMTYPFHDCAIIRMTNSGRVGRDDRLVEFCGNPMLTHIRATTVIALESRS